MLDKLKRLLETGKSTFQRAVAPVTNFARQNPSPISFIQSRLPQVQQEAKQFIAPAVDFARQNPTPYNFAYNQLKQPVQRNIIQPIQQFAQRQIQSPIVQRNIQNTIKFGSPEGINRHIPVLGGLRQLVGTLTQPKRVLNQIADMTFRPPARYGASIKLAKTGGESFIPSTPAQKFLFGREKVERPIQGQVTGLTGLGVPEDKARKIAPYSFALGLGATIPIVGGGKAQGVKGIAKALTRIDDVIKVKQMTGVADDIALSIAKSKDATQIGKLLKNARQGTPASVAQAGRGIASEPPITPKDFKTDRDWFNFGRKVSENWSNVNSSGEGKYEINQQGLNRLTKELNASSSAIKTAFRRYSYQTEPFTTDELLKLQGIKTSVPPTNQIARATGGRAEVAPVMPPVEVLSTKGIKPPLTTEKAISGLGARGILPQKPIIESKIDVFTPIQPQKDVKDSWFTKVREMFQDSQIRVKNLQRTSKVSEGADPYRAEELFHGRVSSRVELANLEVETIFREMSDYSKKSGLDYKGLRGSVNKYLQAIHAPERNLVLGEGAAGITNKQSKDILAEISNSGHGEDVANFASKLRKINERTLDILQESGVLSKKVVENLRKTYKNHVPLQRIMDNDVTSVLGSKGFSVKSTGIKRAIGSQREVDDIAGNILANYEQAIIRAEKNRYGQNVLNFAKNNKDLDLFEIDTAKFLGKAEDGKTFMNRYASDDTLVVFEKGVQRFLKVKDPALAKALTGINAESMPALLRPIAAITRFFSSMATRYNPEFVLSNIVRDSQELAVYVAAQKDLPKGSISAVTQNIPASFNDIRLAIRGNFSGEGAQLYRQMIADGGTTGGMSLSTRKQVQIDINTIDKLVQSKPRQGARALVDGIDKWNQIFEDSTRLSAYKQAIKSGLSRERSASIAKNATINFNKKGSGGAIVNALYMFSNASIQGTTKMLTAMKNPKVLVATVTAVTVPVFATSRWNDSVDPDWREKVSAWDRQSNLVVMYPSDSGSRYFTIPVSWGLKPIKVIADNAYDLSTGKSGNVYDIASKITSAFADAYNPAGGTDLVSAVTPSILDTPVDIARNRKWSGLKIRSDKELRSNYQNYFGSLSKTPLGQVSITATEKVAVSTGGKIDINPADLNYALQQYIGGAGRSAERFLTTGVSLMKGGLPDTKEIPFVNRFFKTQDEDQASKNVEYKTKDDFEKKIKNMKAGSDEQKQFIQEYLWNQPKDDRQGIMYGLQLKGVFTKGLTIKDKEKALRDEADDKSGETFLQNGRASQIIGNQVFRKDNSERGYSITSKISYDTLLTTQKMENAKIAKDLKGWMDLAKTQEQNIITQLNDPTLDELEKGDLQQKLDKLYASVAKYAGYGGFKKGKKGKKAKKFIMPSTSLSSSATSDSYRNLQRLLGATTTRPSFSTTKPIGRQVQLRKYQIKGA